MPATRAALEDELVQELGPIAVAAGISLVRVDDVIASLNGPIRKAIVAGGGSVVDPTFVTDADVISATAPFDTLVTFARIAFIEKILGNYAFVDMKSGELSQSLNQLAVRLKDMLAAIKEELKDPEAIAALQVAGPPVIGVIEDNFYFPCN
jgi:hypothetical protein